MAFVLLDNYDSFTYNLYQALAEVSGEPPTVVTNDDEAALADVDLTRVEGIIISPGPGHPSIARDFGLSQWAVQQYDIPVLGICLGYQGLCLNAGARVDLAPEPMHGRPSMVSHTGDPLFAGIPSPFSVMRYHSLLVYDLPEQLSPIAATEDGLLMAVRHRDRPHWGVQFHPESIATEHGNALLSTFVDLARSWSAGRIRPPALPAVSAARPTSQPAAAATSQYRLSSRRLSIALDVEAAYRALFADDSASFWLDSARQIPGLSRFSILGSAGGELGQRISYRVQDDAVVVRDRHGDVVERRPGDVLTYLTEQLSRRRVASAGLPIDFALGYCGYLGYELKANLGADDAHRSATADAQLIFADRGMVVDHQEGVIWLLALSDGRVDGRGWLDDAEARLRALVALPALAEAPDPHRRPTVQARHSDDEYRDLIEQAQQLIRLGESYEICLTNMLEIVERVDPWETYRRLRVTNPAPFGAFLAFDDVHVLSSSPERFLSIDPAGTVESKPIKGTCSRGDSAEQDRQLAMELSNSEKERAENIMIVDLVRNDIGRCAEIGTVHVPVLCGIESYQTVHQLVSTVRGSLSEGVSVAECVRHAFPGGSMTGAPKIRTMEIIDRLEAGPRGVYSGSIGYFSLDGTVDLSIVIRTIVVTPQSVSIGVGGAITALSDPMAEVREIWLKAEALLATLGQQIAADEAALVSG